MLPLARTTTALAAAAALLAPAAAHAQAPVGQPPAAPRLVVERPTKKLYVREGAAGRYLLGGTWYFRLDDAFQGDPGRWWSQRSLAGWAPVRVPYDWNARDTVFNRSSVGWFRKEFRLPRTPRGRRHQWKLRFESVNHRATVWLNGRRLAVHSPGYLPFEVDLHGLRRGRNRLVVRVSTLRGATDLTHWRPARFNGYGGGGWWNFGGISREVYLRRIDGLDVQDVAVTPRLRCARCAARAQVRALLRNLGRRDRRVTLALTVRGRSTQRIELTPRTVAGHATREVVTGFTIRRPRLWWPGRRNRLYGLTISAAVKGSRVASFRRFFGVRKIQRTRRGQVLLNGRPLRLRGASIHEDDPTTGAALTPGQRSTLVHRLRQLHATVTRAHYPLHPAFLEAFDRAGILFWEDAPVYQVPNRNLNLPRVRANAVRVARDMVLRDRSHPSVLTWSLGNELAGDKGEGGRVGPGYARYVRDGAAAVKELDRTRLVAIDRQSRVGEQVFDPSFRSLSAMGVNEYFGWYPSNAPGLPPTKVSDLGPFLDRVHRENPGLPLFITEFGAEANRSGPATERGTYAFQDAFLRDSLAVHASKPFVNGSLVWILKDFRVVPGWVGGNIETRASPPWNKKGLIDQYGGLKPSFFEMRGLWRRTRPFR